MPRRRFREGMFKRDKLGRFAKTAGSSAGGKSTLPKYKPGTNAQRRQLGKQKLKTTRTLKNHAEFFAKHGSNPDKQEQTDNAQRGIAKYSAKLQDINKALADLRLPDDVIKAIEPEVKRAARPTGKSGSSRSAKGLTEERRQALAKGRKPAKRKASDIRTELAQLADRIDRAVKNTSFESFQKMTNEEKEAFKKDPGNPLNMIRRQIELEREMATMKPDRSRELTDAKSIEDLVGIMADRNPHVQYHGWDEVGGSLKSAMRDFGQDGPVHQKAVKERVARAFDGLEAMMDKYPEVPITSFNAWGSGEFSSPNAIAHCRRGNNLDIDFNVNFLTAKADNLKKNSNGFHPSGFELDPHRNTVIHEFGHALDWVAFGFHEMWSEGSERFVNEPDERRRQAISRNRDIEFKDMADVRGRNLKRAIAGAWVDLGEPELDAVKAQYPESSEKAQTQMAVARWMRENMSGYSFTTVEGRNGRPKKIMHDDEAIAEAFQDVEVNGQFGSSPTSRAIVDRMLEALERRRNAAKS